MSSEQQKSQQAETNKNSFYAEFAASIKENANFTENEFNTEDNDSSMSSNGSEVAESRSMTDLIASDNKDNTAEQFAANEQNRDSDNSSCDADDYILDTIVANNLIRNIDNINDNDVADTIISRINAFVSSDDIELDKTLKTEYETATHNLRFPRDKQEFLTYADVELEEFIYLHQTLLSCQEEEESQDRLILKEQYRIQRTKMKYIGLHLLKLEVTEKAKITNKLQKCNAIIKLVKTTVDQEFEFAIDKRLPGDLNNLYQYYRAELNQYKALERKLENCGETESQYKRLQWTKEFFLHTRRMRYIEEHLDIRFEIEIMKMKYHKNLGEEVMTLVHVTPDKLDELVNQFRQLRYFDNK